MKTPFPIIHSLLPTLPRTVLWFGHNAGKIFLVGFLLASFLGVASFYFFAYRLTQQGYVGITHLEGVNRGLLTQTLKQLQDQQSKAQNPPVTNPFE